jgi:hypothetical protein
MLTNIAEPAPHANLIMLNNASFMARCHRYYTDITTTFPVRFALPPGPGVPIGDWPHQLVIGNYIAFQTLELQIHGSVLRDLHFESTNPDVRATECLVWMAQDIGVNFVGGNHHQQNLALTRLRSIKVSTITQSDPLSIGYTGEIGLYPALERLSYSYGVPLISLPHNNIRELYLDKFACRHAANGPNTHGQLPNFVAPLNGQTDRHLLSHCHITTAFRNMQQLEIVELTETRLCNFMLAGTLFLNTAANNAGVHIPGLGATMRHNLHNLISFKVKSMLYNEMQGQYFGYWLFSNYFSNFGSFATFLQFRHLDLDCWFFFPGRLNAHTSANHQINAIGIGSSMETIRVSNLTDGYCQQFYDWLLHIEQAKVNGLNGGLPHLHTISCSMLSAANGGTGVFPPAAMPLDWAQLKALMANAGITLRRYT